jgi:hypothetical protein
MLGTISVFLKSQQKFFTDEPRTEETMKVYAPFKFGIEFRSHITRKFAESPISHFYANRITILSYFHAVKATDTSFLNKLITTQVVVSLCHSSFPNYSQI